jgi:NAD(P)-dependent dehydrogenase (short-subunit alcohol dehydrogenase family)
MARSETVKAVVTGGSSGIGRAVVNALIGEGDEVAILDLSETSLSNVFFARADVTNSQEVEEAVRLAATHLNGIDVLINCAGIGAIGGVEVNSDEEWHHVFDVNVCGIARVTRAALPFLKQSTVASIVNVSSIAATVGIPDRVLYSATKGAVLSMSLAMAADLLPHGIRVNVVNPGTTATPWVDVLLSKAADPAAERIALESRQPHGRLVTSDEVAQAILYLASPHSGSTTGTYLAVDGGMQRLRTQAKR